MHRGDLHCLKTILIESYIMYRYTESELLTQGTYKIYALRHVINVMLKNVYVYYTGYCFIKAVIEKGLQNLIVNG